MKLYVITGACGAGKSTVRDALEEILDKKQYACIDTDEVGINWWDYAGTDYESKFSDDCLAEAVRLAAGRDLVFTSCLNPLDYITSHGIPKEIKSTCFIVLCPTDDEIEKRLRNRPAERGFTSEEAIRPHVEYNRWFRKNEGKFPLFIDNTDSPIEETVEQIAAFINNKQ